MPRRTPRPPQDVDAGRPNDHRNRDLSLVSAPVPRGRLLFVEDVRREVFNDRVSAWWVRRNVAPAAKIRLGHSTVAWYEEDVWAWVNERKGA